MASPRTKGRMLNRDISDSKGFAKLSPPAAVLFCMLIPNYSPHGKMNGDPGYLKGEICPRISYLTLKNIPAYLKEINKHTSVKWFEHEERMWIHSTNFLTEHQQINLDRVGPDLLPNYSGVGPDLLPPEVEVEVEVKGEVKGEGEGKSGVALPDKSGPPPPNGFSPDDMARLWNEGIEFFEKEGPVLIPKVLKLTPDRKKKAAARIRDCQVDEVKWKRIIDIVHHSPFLSGEKPGKGHEDWRADFDFTIKSESTLTKILEGGYT